jgi:predicted DCC family thiol-disulfide oxidoreductase YuxK
MNTKVVIFYNADCPVCVRIRKHLEGSSAAEEFTFWDANTAQLPPGVTRAQALDDVYITDDGVTYRAGDTLPRLMRRLPYMRVLAAILEVPPFIWLVRIAYRLLADNRPFFGRFIP